jgi:hypothetical protein
MDEISLAPAGAAERDEAPILYERDFYLWCFKQADLLRLRRFDEADRLNIVEELESMGKSQRAALRSSYRLLVAHLLKWQFQPERRSPSWEVTITRERAHIEEHEEMSPSLKREAQSLVDETYRKARKEAQVETGLPLSTFPPACPYTLDQLRDDDWMPDTP